MSEQGTWIPHSNVLVWLILAFGMVPVPSLANDSPPVFRAGAAISNITPPLGELIVGGWKPIPAQHIHDELYARCLVLDDGKVKLGIVLCDNVGIPQEVFDLAKEQVRETTGLPRSHLLMAATHTHSATTARGPSKMIHESELTDYQRFLAGRISDGVRRALNQLEPAQIGWGTVDEPTEVFNRRWFVSDAGLLTNPFGGTDRVRMNPPRGSPALDRQAGPVDPQISFISVQSTEGRPIAMLANYSLHYVGGVRSGDVSADYFGYFARIIGEKLGAENQSPPFVGMLSNGTSGDVNNINFKQKSPRKYQPYEKMQEVAKKVATRVHEAHQQIKFHDWVPLGASQTALPLKVRVPTAEMLRHFEGLKADETRTGHKREAIYAERIARLQAAPEEVRVPLQALRIGELGISAIPFETFAETGLELKDKSPFRHTFTIELANGSFGYLPTPEQHRLGGYETWLGTNNVETDASTKIVQTILRLFRTLRDDADAERSPPLWNPSKPLPKANELPTIADAKFHIIKAHVPQEDGFDWLHGVALASHGNRLYATFGHNTGAENTASEIAHSCYSTDGGATWSDLQLIDHGEAESLAISHGVLLSTGGKLWAFHGAFHGHLRDVHTRAYVLDDATDSWIKHGIVIGDGFWPMDTPQKMDDGNWVVSGIRIQDGNGGANDPAAIAISKGDDLTKWDLVVIPKQDNNDMWGESTVFVDGASLLNIARYRKPIALVARSEDHGRTWSTSHESNLPMAASKPFAGVLSTGVRYLICTTSSDSGNRRSPLTIAVADPGELSFHRVYCIRSAEHGGPGESHRKAALAYPYAVEHGGKLYVAYSNDGGRGRNRNSAELAVIPIESLSN